MTNQMPPKPQTLKEIGAEFDHLFIKKGGKNGKNSYFKESPELIREFCLTKLSYFAESMRMEEKIRVTDKRHGLLIE